MRGYVRRVVLKEPLESGPSKDVDLRVISLGAGVQSSTLALMAAQGLVKPMPDAGIFADTQWEPLEVYRWLWYLTKQLPFPVYVVTHGDLRTKIERGAKRKEFLPVPFHTDSGIGRRQCTREYKLAPITKQIRTLLGLRPRQRVGNRTAEVWVGISKDEFQRMKPSRWEWIQNRWPLIEADMTREDCKEWMRAEGYPEPPRSACLACPYKSNGDWRQTLQDSTYRKEVITLDRLLRKRGEYLHYSRKPLEQVDLDDPDDELSRFDNECEGMCGV